MSATKDGHWHYSPHFFAHAEGHLYIETPTDDEPCTITLKPAASADQEWINEKGELIARAVNAAIDAEGETIFDLWRKVQAHPDYVFGSMFVRGDIPDGRKLPDDFSRKYVEEYLVQMGNQVMLFETVRE